MPRIICLLLMLTLLSACLDDKRNREDVAIEEDSLYMDGMDSLLDQGLSDPAVNTDSLKYYLGQLGNPEFVDHSDGQEWYIAAEELGLMGKAAIPYLILKLDSASEYERGQALYALRLAAQQDNVTAVTGGDFVEGNGMAMPEGGDQKPIIQAWKQWYLKYKDAFAN